MGSISDLNALVISPFTDGFLLLEFSASVSEPGTSPGYGGTSSTTALTSFKSLVNAGGAYELKLPDGFKVIPGFDYWIMKDEKLERFLWGHKRREC